MTYNWLLCFLLCAWVPMLGNAADADIRGELTIYDRETQIGVVAQRVFRDTEGRVIKRIYYRPRLGVVKGPYREEDLVQCSVRIIEHTEQGRIEKEIRGTGMGQGVTTVMEEVTLGQGKKMIRRRADGSKEYEIRWQGGQSVSHLYFDETGKNLVAVTGTIPADLDRLEWWGKPVGGISCAVGVNTSQAALPDIVFFVTVRNMTAQERKVITCLQYHEIRLELRDEAGTLVPQDTQYIEKRDQRLKAMNRGINESTQVLKPHKVATYDGGRRLADWYRTLPAGTYHLTVKRRANDADFTLITRPVKLQIVGDAE